MFYLTKFREAYLQANELITNLLLPNPQKALDGLTEIQEAVRSASIIGTIKKAAGQMRNIQLLSGQVNNLLLPWTQTLA